MLLFTFSTIQLHPESALLPFRRDYPRSFLPWRIVAHMLGVTAGEVRYPISDFVEMKANNLLLQGRVLFDSEFFLPLGRHHIRVPGWVPHYANVRFRDAG